MRLSFNETRNDPKAVFYSRCTIDLSSRGIRIAEVACQNLEEVLGGVGRSLQFLAARTVTRAYSPENPVIVNTGILTGSSLMTGLRTYFSAYSPLKVSNKGLPGAMWSAGSDKFGSKLKWTGLDELIFEGRASEPIMIVIRGGGDGPKVEFKPARHLLGLACYKKINLLKQEYADAHFAVIGPAGEHYQSCYFGAVALSTENLLKSGDDKCRFAGRGGMGSVLGYKNVIAIVAQAHDQLEGKAGDPRHQPRNRHGPRLAQVSREGQRRARRHLERQRNVGAGQLITAEQFQAEGGRQTRADVASRGRAAIRH